MINKSIAYRLSIYISLAVISVFIGFIIISYLFNRNLLRQNIENKAIGESAKIIKEVERYLVSTKEITTNVANQVYYYGQNNEVECLISTVMEKYPFLNAIHINFRADLANVAFHNYYGYQGSDSVLVTKMNNRAHCCPTQKENTDLIIDRDTSGWTEPFRCFRDSNIVVSYFCPIKIEKNNNIQIIGDVVCELSLLDLSHSINDIKFGSDGYAFLVSKGGDYVTYPIEKWILNRNLYSLSDKIYDKKKVDVKGILENKMSGSIIGYSEIFDYKKTWVYYSPIKENGWMVIFNIPYDELFQPLYKNLLLMLLVSVIGILIIYFIIAFITNKLVEPLSTVTSQLRAFSNLSGKEDFSSQSVNEVKAVSDSLNYMKSWYEEYKVKLSKELKNHNRRIEDLMQASEIQKSLIKTNFPAFPKRRDVDLYGIYKPAKIVSGDLFDFFFIDDDNLVFTIGDVSGKGIPAAIFMSVAQTIIKSNANLKKAKSIVGKANLELFTNNQHQFFLTLFLGVLNTKTGSLNYCNAAHTSTFILKSNGEIVSLEQSHGLPLGLYPDKEYSDSKIDIEYGDTIILYTDGITELQDKNSFLFGEERLKEHVSHLAGETPEVIAKNIEQTLDIFRAEVNQADDISLLILKYTPQKKA